MNKEIIFLKVNIKRCLFLAVIVVLISMFIMLRGKKSLIDLRFILGLTSSSFIINIIFDSMMLEKKNKSFEKMLQLNSLTQIINSKAIISFIISTLISLLFSSILILNRGYSFKDFYIVFLLVPFLNLVFSKIFCLILLLNDQVILIQIVTMAFALCYVILFTSIERLEEAILLGGFSIFTFFIVDIFINRIEIEKII
ncbi:hypothetical protein HMPREF1092_02097 [Clostridium thermobutyricum]|uniref:Uncharacterized protein n=1 Tax=Clostridium thermobutyricum TaxID=29372 RepID=N9XNU2_9CLOT|nr:hypothetical protein HMPREF1092_02097 [Clostridium thermobutyricum]